MEAEVVTPVDELEFFMIRLPLLSSASSPVGRKHAGDRTTEVIRKLVHNRKALLNARRSTPEACEVRRGKDGVVALFVADELLFQAHQNDIKRLTDEINDLEDAIRKLDAFAPGREVWYNALDDDISIHSNHASQGDCNAMARVEVLKPLLDQLKGILEAVGC